MSNILTLENICKSYNSPSGSEVRILSGLDLSVSSGEIVSIVGKSGSGKSTLLSIAALLTPATSGSVYYEGRLSSALSEKERAALRSRAMGFIFQSSDLLDDFSALENVAMPLLIQGKRKKDAFHEAESFLSVVGLSDRKDHRPAALSGGERQRAAIARALSASPLVIFADEPTGSLDEGSAAEIESLLISAVKDTGRCMLMVTHDISLARRCDRMLELREGRLHDV